MAAKKILMLSGVAQMCEIVEDARSAGHYVVVTDYLEDSPAKKLADESWMLSIDDVDGIVNKCRERDIDGVMNYCIDPGQKPYQQICERLGLPCVGTREQFDVMTNKDRFKKACARYGVGTLDSFVLGEDLRAEDVAALRYPVMVKPADGRASKGITRVTGPEGLKEAVRYARENSRCGEFIVEAFADAPEVCAKYVVCDGEPFLTSMADVHPSFMRDGKKAYIGTQTYPSAHLDDFLVGTDARIRGMIRSLGIRNGALSFTGFHDGDEFRFFDPSFRMGGAQDWRLVAAMSGVDISRLLTNFALTGSMGPVDEVAKVDLAFAKYYSALLYFNVHPGKIGSIEGVQEACEVSGVIGYHAPHVVGDVVDRVGTVDHVALRFLIVCDTEPAFVECVRRVQGLVDIKDVEGESMLLPLFDSERAFKKDANIIGTR